MSHKKSNIYYEARATLESELKQLGIYDYLTNRDDITEIQINPDSKIFVNIQGKGSTFTGDYANSEKVRHIINILASLEGLIINSENPRISTILPITESRFEGLVPPVVKNPSCTIRKKSIKLLTLDDYVNQKTFTENEKELLEKYVKEHKNILIVGGTNTGKTTFANALIKCMKNERLYFIEEVQELQTDNENTTFVQVFPEIFTPKDALKTALRWSPERIIYGEVRGAEAFDLINVLNSGHKGGLCTIHANDCYSGLEKIETYILYEKANPMSQVIARTLDVVVTMVIENYVRKLDSIAEIKGYENGKYILDFKFKKD